MSGGKSMVGYIALLAPCGHKALYDPIPKAQQPLFCRRCNDYRLCVEVSRAWRMRCTTCGRTHEYGADVGRIRRVAVRHSNANPDHVVWVMGGTDPPEQVLAVGQVPLPTCDIQPPDDAVE